MKIAIVHLSDIHLKQNESENFVLKRVTKIFDSVKNKFAGAEAVFILVTGDLAFSGLQSEYAFAKKFLEDMKSQVSNYTKLPINIITIPGNHDCDFSKKTSVRSSVINQLQTNGYKNIDPEIIDCCCGIQEQYFEFEGEITKDLPTAIHNEKLLKIYNFQYQKFNITFNCFNTSWVSQKREEEGQLAFPTEYFSDGVFNNKSDLTIHLIHHPINWLNNSHHREFRRLLEEHGDLVLSGHEHQKTQREVKEKNGPTTIYLEAGSLQENIATASSFNFYIFDLEKSAYDYFEYSLDNGNYKIECELQERKYDHRYGLSKRDFYQTLAHKNFLMSTDAQFAHSQVDQVYLPDIYVFPKLRHITLDVKNKREIPKIISSETLLNQLSGGIKWTIAGDESSGKTALCKMVNTYFFENDYVPIYLTGEILNQINIDKLTKLIKEQFLDQYEKKCEQKFDVLDKSKLILIVDGIENCNVKGRFRIQLIENLKKICDNLIFTGNANLLFEPILDEKKNTKVDVFGDFEDYQLLQFGADLRQQLIGKWNSLGADLSNDEERDALYRRNDNADAQIKTTIGNNYIPSYPLTILTLLQTLELGTSNPDYSLFGYYYEYLIGNSLNEAVIEKDSLQFYHNLLAELFHFFFDSKVKNISLEDFKTFYNEYSRRYTTNEDISRVLTTLQLAKIIKIENLNFITYSYKYIYYYYVAKYFANKIAQNDIKEKISKICKRLYREEFAQIIVFLTHLSKDPFILTEIYENATQEFNDIEITRLEDDISAINKLVEDIPQLVIDTKSIPENRAAQFISQAEAEELEKDFEANRESLDYDLNEDLNSIDVLSKILRAIKTFELLGQITKKYWGSIEGVEKYKYAKATFDLSLRTLNFYFKHILSYKSDMIKIIKAIAIKKKLDDLSEIQDATNAYIFKLCCISSYGSIKRVSDTIGHKRLQETFDEIIKDNPYNSYKLIDLAIKLEHSPSFPEDDVIRLIEDPNFNKNFLPKFLVQNFVSTRMSLFGSDIKSKQVMSDKLKIKIQGLRTADYGSSQKK